MIFESLKDLKDNFKKEPIVINMDETSAKSVIDQYNNMKLGADAFIEKTKLSDEAMESYLHTVQSGNATFAGYTKHINDANSAIGLMGIKTKVTTALVNGLKIALSTIGIMLVTNLIGYLVTAIDNFIHRSERIAETAKEAKKKIDELNSSFKELESTTNNVKEKYAELAQGVDQLTGKNLTLSTDDYNEFLNLSNQLSELFPTLTKNYDENGNAILDLSGNVESIVSSLDDLIKRQRDLANEEMLENLPDIYEDYSNKVDGYSKKLEEAKKKQQGYQSLYDSMKDIPYEVSDDKREVTFTLTDFTNKEKEETLKELTSGIDDVNHVLTQDLDDKTTTITLYLDNAFNGFEPRLKSAQDEIRKYTDKIKEETSSFSSYMNTWLQGESWEFQQIDDSQMQQTLKEVLFNKEWIDVAREELGKDATWDDLASWVETNYINAINGINNDEIKKDFIKLFTTDLTPEDAINLAQKIQDWFNQNDIKVSLDFILDENDPSSTQNLVNRFNESTSRFETTDPEGYADLVKYTQDFDDVQMETWLRVTGGITDANEAIRTFINSTTRGKEGYTTFFTDENDSLVDGYVSKINQLTEYYNKLHTAEGLSQSDKIELNQAYGIVEDSSEDYKNAILNEISTTEQFDDVIETLKQSIEECTDEQEKIRLETLLANLQNLSAEAIKAAEGFDTLGNSMSTLKSKADFLRDLKKDMDKFGKIDVESLNEILTLFPELETQVALYNAGLMDSSKLFELLEEAYKTDANIYAGAMAEKMQYNEDFYSSIYEKLPQHIKDLADSYNIDLDNYKTLCAAKLGLEGELAKKRAELYDAITEDYNISKDPYASKEEKEQVHGEYQVVQKSYNEVESIFNSIMETAFQSFNTSWKSYGKGNDDDDTEEEKEKQEINWVEQSLKVLQEAVDDTQTSLENTKGFDAQIDAIDTLNASLRSLKKGYKKAYKAYSAQYTAKLNTLSNPTEIQRKIESGESFKFKEYKPEDAETIQELIDLYDKMTESEDKMTELGLEIDNNENIEKSILRQEDYEKELESIQAKLEDQTLTITEKNDLLKDELEYQQKINEEMAVRAEYEGDEKGAATLRKKNENLGQQTEGDLLQNDIALNDTYIEGNKERLNNPNLTKDEIDFINARDKSLQEQAFDYRFQEIRNTIDDETWNLYIEDLRKKYNELTLSEEELIDKYFEDIAQYFNYTGMEKLYYEKLNYGIDASRTDYDTNKDISSYYINDNNNQISDIQHDIDYAGGRGTEEQYKTMKSLHKENLALLTNQRQEVEKMLQKCDEGTKAWDDWNKEIQECDDGIAACERSVKDCEISILKLPLNDIEDRLMDIENQLDDINEMIEYNNSYISAASFILDKTIRQHNKEKELIQDQIDALEKVNNARQNSLKLQQAEYNLRKLENQRTNKVFIEGKGWEFQSDPDELRNAQASYDQAVFDNKVFLLNEEIRLHDEEITRLNRIKEEWSWITTEAQGMVDLNQARLYDLQFEAKVLSGNALLTKTIADNMKTYYADKKTYEDEQKNYQKLQDDINDTATAYELEAIDYEEARRRISNSIKLYYPEIFEKYGEESEKIKEIIDKQLEEANITEESSKDINKTVDESNKKLVESYTKLVTDLEDVFKQLNTMLSTYSTNAQNMANSVAASIAAMKSAMGEIDSASGKVNDKNSGKSSGKSSTKKSNTSTKPPKIDGAGKSHSGMELGYIGEGSTSNDKKAFKYIALNKLKDDEIVRVLQKGEGVTTEGQINTIMSNFRKLSEFKAPTLSLRNSQPSQSVEFNGDIVIQNPVGDSSKLAREIRQNLSQAVLQELYK